MIKKCGYVAISGPTNSGKSTLLNAIFEKKVSIVSHKVQTTLKSLDAVKNYKDTQIVFIDTPGFYQKKNDANYFKDVLSSIDRSDLLLIILDITSKFHYLGQIEKIIERGAKRVLAIFGDPALSISQKRKQAFHRIFYDKTRWIWSFSLFRKKNTARPWR